MVVFLYAIRSFAFFFNQNTLNESRKRKFGSRHCSGEAVKRGLFLLGLPVPERVGSDLGPGDGTLRAQRHAKAALPSIFKQAIFFFGFSSGASVGFRVLCGGGGPRTSRAGNSLGGTSFFHCCRKKGRKLNRSALGFLSSQLTGRLASAGLGRRNHSFSPMGPGTDLTPICRSGAALFGSLPSFRCLV